MKITEKPFSRFLIVWIGQLISKVGAGISAFALGIFLFQRIGTTSAYSFLLLCAVLPSILLAPIGGVFADRMDRKLMMLIADLGAAFCVLFILIMIVISPDSYWPIYVGITLCSISTAFHSPAYKASISDILDEASYAKASGLIQLAEASRYLIAPMIAGLLMTKLSVSWVLGIDFFTFLFAALCVLAIRTVTATKPISQTTNDFKMELKAGVDYVRYNLAIRQLLLFTIIVTFLTGVLQVLFVPIVLTYTDVSTLGKVQSFSACGMIFSSLFIGLLSKTSQQYKVLSWSLAFTGLFYMLIGTASTTFIFTVMAFAFFLTLPFVNTSLEVLFRQNITSDMQGRVWSLISFISQIGLIMALAITGILADFVFNPLLTDTGLLADSVGRFMGTGANRGSSLLVVICGAMLILYTARIRLQNAAKTKPLINTQNC